MISRDKVYMMMEGRKNDEEAYGTRYSSDGRRDGMEKYLLGQCTAVMEGRMGWIVSSWDKVQL